MNGVIRSAVAAAYLCLAGPAFGDFVVENVRADLVDRELRVSTRINLQLSEQAERAVENGVTLVVVTEFSLVREGLVWNESLAEYRRGQQLRYHSLSDRYVVENLDRSEINTYGSVAEALQNMGDMHSLVFPLPDDVHSGNGYKLAVRSRLDINQLPAPLRPLAFFSPSWRLSSDWTTWPITSP